MPTYEYECEECGHHFDEFQNITEKPREICPVCNGHVHRVINGGAGLIFKGSGFYITDYKNAKMPGSNGNGNGKHSSPPADSSGRKPSNGKSGSSDSKD